MAQLLGDAPNRALNRSFGGLKFNICDVRDNVCPNLQNICTSMFHKQMLEYLNVDGALFDNLHQSGPDTFMTTIEFTNMWENEILIDWVCSDRFLILVKNLLIKELVTTKLYIIS